jgi:ribonuclease P protein component
VPRTETHRTQGLTRPLDARADRRATGLQSSRREPTYPQPDLDLRPLEPLTYTAILLMVSRLSGAGAIHGLPPIQPELEHETHLPTQPPQTCPDARIPRAHGDAQRAQGPERPSREGTRSTDPLNDAPTALARRERRQAFPRAFRLTQSRQYRAVFDAPRRRAGPGLIVLYRENGLQHPRLGLAISKKCARRAVDRVRLKRIARESFRLNRSRLGGWDVVVLCGSGAPLLPSSRLFATLSRAWLAIESQPCVASSSP